MEFFEQQGEYLQLLVLPQRCLEFTVLIFINVISMKYQRGEKISTETTVCSTSRFVSNNQYQTQNRQLNRQTSILAVESHNRILPKFGSYDKNSAIIYQKQSIKNSHKKDNSFNYDQKKTYLVNSLSSIVNRRKSYCFQIIKQFFIFPDQTASSNWSVSVYDKLIFHDENIHTMVKILQTKTIQNKIWGFINLKTLPKIKAAKIITQTVDQILIRNKRIIKKQSFQYLKQYSQGIQLRILKQKINKQPNLVQIQSKIIESKLQKTDKRINCSFSTVSQQVRPIQRVRIQSPVKIYRYQKSTTSQYQKTKTQNTGPSTTGARIVYPAQVYKYQQQKKQKINKYNIINYYERPRTILDQRVRQHDYQHQKSHLRSICCNCCQGRCSQSCEASGQCRRANQICTNYGQQYGNYQKCTSVLNQTCFTQYKDQKHYNYQLSELQSRIQYLKFLQKVVKQQEIEQNQSKMC